ncbi:MAG: PTS sugar transporter subunit IIA [Sarcina sp.]
MGFFNGLFKKETKEYTDSVIEIENIKLNLDAPKDKYEAIRLAGKLLVENGYVKESYIDAMIQREDDITTYLGFEIAIPHGTSEAKKHVKKTGIVFLQFNNGVPFGDEKAKILIGIAAKNDEHLTILSNIAMLIEKEEEFEMLKTSTDKKLIMKILTSDLIV